MGTINLFENTQLKKIFRNINLVIEISNYLNEKKKFP